MDMTLPVTSRPLARDAHAGASDSDLVQRTVGGDTTAFEAIMRRYNRPLFRTARAILRDDAEAEDALQEAYLQAYRTLASYRGEARLSTWLARVVANEALGRLRRHARRAAIVPLDASVSLEQIDEKAEGSMEKSPEASARRAEMRKLLEARIDALPGAYRAVFMLRAVEEYSVGETAAILGIPEPTVRSRFFRARSLLREGLAAEADLACTEAFAFAGERCDRVVQGVLARLARKE
jgi:RNA polymerase sigma-70 factor (ECF subfamily)